MTTKPILDILLIEDEMSSTLLSDKISRELEGLVNIHRNGNSLSEDIEMYKDKEIDIIILDEEYTGIDAFEAVKLIRKKTPTSQIIVLAEEKEELKAHKVKSIGAYEYVVKDKIAADRVVYSIKDLWNNKYMLNENLRRFCLNNCVIIKIIISVGMW
ncbi:MAG: response regulator transcription factor [Cytophagaceae bacterium]